MQHLILVLALYFITSNGYGQSNYHEYHKEVLRCEQLIAEHKFKKAIYVLDSLFNRFDFIFQRECKLATELSVYEHDDESALRFLRLGILSGWTIKDIKKNKRLKKLHDDPEWTNLKTEYDSLHKVYWSRINIPLRQEAQELFKKDQKIAIRVLFRIGEKNKIKYALKKFAPHSENTMIQLKDILIKHGYPGEKLIGNSWWVSVNLSHHNSIYTEYTQKDTLYPSLRPELLKSIERGELHPKDFAIIEDWRNASLYQHESSLNGFLGKIPDNSALEIVNQNRNKIGLRSIGLRNTLLDIEEETGLNLYLPKGWHKGKITVANN